MPEIWKDIVGYEGLYQVSNLGNVKSLHYRNKKIHHILSPRKHHTGYLMVSLTSNRKAKCFNVHRLVAIAFIPNPNDLPCVNHKDGNKHNNNVSNLEWVTHQQNTRHAIATGLLKNFSLLGKTGSLHPTSKVTLQYTKSGQFVRKWDCISDAAKAYGKDPCTIVNCCAGRAKSCAGYIWKYPE